MTKKQLFNIIEKEGWEIHDEDDSYRIAQYSPAGEDYSFAIEKGTVEKMIDHIEEYYLDFNPDEHAKIWIDNMTTVPGVPQSIRVLIDDAEKIEEMLDQLTKKLREVA